jgi:hypothetical protein
MSRSNLWKWVPTWIWITHLCLYVDPFSNVCLRNVEGAPFICLTSISIYSDHWKSFVKFEIKTSHEMVSYNLYWIAFFNVTWVMFHILRRQCFICSIGHVSYVAQVMFHRSPEQCFNHATYVSLVMFPMFHSYYPMHMLNDHAWLMQVIVNTLDTLRMKNEAKFIFMTWSNLISMCYVA